MSKGTSSERSRHEARRYRRAAIIAVAGLVAILLIAFVGRNPFSHPYEIRGVFSSANQLRVSSEVRIAGLKVGQVSDIEPGPENTSIVTLQIEDAGRPIHADASLAIEPRLVLEGNFYVALAPGSPDAPDAPSGATIPRERTTVPVQLDQVLDTFDLPTRGALHRSIGELAGGLGPETSEPGASGTPQPVPAGYASLRRAVRELAGALPPATAVARATLGTSPGDLGRAVRTGRDVTGQLASDPRALADSVTNFSRLTGVLADESRAVTASVRALDRLMQVAPPGLQALDRALPAVTRFAAALRPALRSAPSPLRRGTRFVEQLQRLFAPSELPALLEDLAPALRTLPTLEQQLIPLSGLLSRANACLTKNVIWTLNQKLPDGNNSTGDPVYLDTAHAIAGSGGIVAGFDGNGVATRAGITGNGTTISGAFPGLGPVIGSSPKIEGIRPVWLGYGVEPPYRPDEWCDQQPRPNLGLRSGPAPELPQAGRRLRIGGILP